MEWLDKIKDFPNLIQQEPRYGYLVVAGLLLIWLVGVICGWKWTYSRPGSTGGNFWMNLLGPENFPVLAGSDSCRRDRTVSVPVLYFRQIAECSFPDATCKLKK